MSVRWLLLLAPLQAAPRLAPGPASGAAPERGLFRALAGLAGALLLAALVAAVAAMPLRTWSAARLAPSAALVHGLPVYTPADAGAVLSTLYGPVSVLYFLPAFLAGDVTTRILVAGVLNVLALVVPFAWLLLARRGAGPRDGPTLAVLLTGTLAALLGSHPLRQMLGGIHVDAPAIGLGLSSCAVLERHGGAPGRARLALAALLVVLSAWTKQVEAPLALAQLLYLGLRFGRALAWRYFAWLGAWSLAAGAVFLAAFDPAGLYFNLLRIPAGHPFVGLRGVAQELLLHALPIALLAAAGLLAARAGRRGRALLEVDGALFALGAVLLFPTSVLARAKLGGFVNSLHFLAYLLAAGVLALRCAASVPSTRPAAARLARALAAVTLLAAVACWPWRELRRGVGALRDLHANPQQEAYEFARAHPGQAYFPWNPLSTLASDGELYHYEWAVVDRELAGQRMSDAHVRAHLPPRMEYVLFPPGEPRNMLRYLPEFTREVRLAGMERWIVYAR